MKPLLVLVGPALLLVACNAATPTPTPLPEPTDEPISSMPKLPTLAHISLTFPRIGTPDEGSRRW